MSLLVADYGSSSEDEDAEPRGAASTSAAPATTTAPAASSSPASASVASTSTLINPSIKADDDDDDDDLDSPKGHISDEEDDVVSRLSSRVGDELDDYDVGLSTSSFLNLPKPKNSGESDASSSSALDSFPKSDSSASLNLSSSLPAPKADAFVGQKTDEELEDFVKPRDWEREEADKEKSTKSSKSSSLTTGGASVVATKTKGGKVKISIPSLRIADDDDDQIDDAGVAPSRDKEPKQGSGLFALLPKPKNISENKTERRTLIPHVLTKKATTAAKSADTRPTKRSADWQGTTTTKTATNPSEISDAESGNFFSLDDTKSPSLPSIPSSSAVRGFRVAHPDPEDAPLAFKRRKSEAPASAFQSNAAAAASSSVTSAQMYNVAAMSSQDASALHAASEEAELQRSNLAKLAGSINVRGRELDDVNFVDVSADEALGGSSEIEENLLRELSAASQSGHRPRPAKGSEPSGLSKRKHQITYLAFQAKEREQMLKNQWAQSAQTRRQTQAKYGF